MCLAAANCCDYLSVHGCHGFLDDVALHRTQRAEQFAFLPFRDLELVERGDEIADQRVKVAAADAHAGMGGLHAAAGIGAGAARGLANLFHQQHLQARNVGVGKLAINAIVSGDAPDEVIHDSGNRRLAA